MNTLSERVQRVLTEKAMTYDALAEVLGVTKGSVSQYINGRTKNLSAKVAARFELVGFNPQWVATGQGEAYHTTQRCLTALCLRLEHSSPLNTSKYLSSF